ncbi:MAG: transcription antitermination factor NusB [Imperialibacter sp.]|uniref:transcription antitermination factor NusB n=1 Tax=Imperialibacter sp. TaxID=2038411 RepID=UPI0032ED2BA0
MLNRRTLRIKAVQSYFALEQSIISDFEIANQQIADHFQPDLNSMEPQDAKLLRKKGKIAQTCFAEQHKNDVIQYLAEADDEMRKSVADAVTYFRNQVKKDKEAFQSRMLKDVDSIHDSYYLALMLPVEFALHVSKEKRKQLGNLSSEKIVVANDYNLADNKVVQALLDFEPLQQQLGQRSLSWSAYRDDTSIWYKDILKADEAYKAYQLLSNPTLEQDKEVVLHIVKRLFFKHPTIQTFMDEKDLYWEENSGIVKSLAVKTIKAYQGQGEPFQLLELSANLEDDLDYFRDLFKITFANNEEYEAIVAEKSKNWEIDRIALIDKVILKMAIAEMVHFPSIPVKVTINEFIEISKNYSTPKSKQFVNGLLDVLANDLAAKGVIKKSGRGLIDNK